MNELELRQMFKNLSDCYADTWSQDGLGAPMVEGEVIQAMTEDRFIEALKQAKLLPIPAVMVELPENHICRYSKAMNQPYPRLCVDCGKPKGN